MMVKQLCWSPEPAEVEGDRSRAVVGPLGSCLAEVSAPDKVFMTLGQFTADAEEVHATGPLMEVS